MSLLVKHGGILTPLDITTMSKGIALIEENIGANNLAVAVLMYMNGQKVHIILVNMKHI